MSVTCTLLALVKIERHEARPPAEEEKILLSVETKKKRLIKSFLSHT